MPGQPCARPQAELSHWERQPTEVLHSLGPDKGPSGWWTEAARSDGQIRAVPLRAQSDMPQGHCKARKKWQQAGCSSFTVVSIYLFLCFSLSLSLGRMPDGNGGGGGEGCLLNGVTTHTQLEQGGSDGSGTTGETKSKQTEEKRHSLRTRSVGKMRNWENNQVAGNLEMRWETTQPGSLAAGGDKVKMRGDGDLDRRASRGEGGSKWGSKRAGSTAGCGSTYRVNLSLAPIFTRTSAFLRFFPSSRKLSL